MDRLLAGTDQLDHVIARGVLHIFSVDPPDLIARKQFVHTRTAFRHEPNKNRCIPVKRSIQFSCISFLYYIFLPDDDGLFAAGHETETEFRVAGEFDFARLRRLLPPILAGILVRRRFVQVTIAIIRDATKEEKNWIIEFSILSPVCY